MLNKKWLSQQIDDLETFLPFHATQFMRRSNWGAYADMREAMICQANGHTSEMAKLHAIAYFSAAIKSGMVDC